MAFTELKARQSVMWGNGPYERITNTIRDIHTLIVDRLAPAAGDSTRERRGVRLPDYLVAAPALPGHQPNSVFGRTVMRRLGLVAVGSCLMTT